MTADWFCYFLKDTYIWKYYTLTCVFSYGIGRIFLQECYHHVRVQFKSGNNHQDKQGGVGHNADEWVIADGNQGGKDGAKDDPSVYGILPLVGAFKAHYELKSNSNMQCYILLTNNILF